MIHTETTPNPDSLKFLSEKTISASGTEEFQKKQKDKVTIPFVKELLDFKGVELILLSEKPLVTEAVGCKLLPKLSLITLCAFSVSHLK